MAKKTKQNRLIMAVMGNSTYRGKHVVIMKNKVYAVRTGNQVNVLLDRLEKKYPRAVPTITYVPKADTLILFL